MYVGFIDADILTQINADGYGFTRIFFDFGHWDNVRYRTWGHVRYRT
jgi:hypothetical protein